MGLGPRVSHQDVKVGSNPENPEGWARWKSSVDTPSCRQPPGIPRGWARCCGYAPLTQPLAPWLASDLPGLCLDGIPGAQHRKRKEVRTEEGVCVSPGSICPLQACTCSLPSGQESPASLLKQKQVLGGFVHCLVPCAQAQMPQAASAPLSCVTKL